MDHDDRMRFAAGETEQLPPAPPTQPEDEDGDDRPLPEPPADDD